MAITREEVLHVARLARLELTRRRGGALPGAAVGDPGGGLEGVRARPVPTSRRRRIRWRSRTRGPRTCPTSSPAAPTRRSPTPRTARTTCSALRRRNARPRTSQHPWIIGTHSAQSRDRHVTPSLRRFRQGGNHRPLGARTGPSSEAGLRPEMSATGIDTLRVTAEEALGCSRAAPSRRASSGTPIAPRSTPATASCTRSSRWPTSPTATACRSRSRTSSRRRASARRPAPRSSRTTCRSSTRLSPRAAAPRTCPCSARQTPTSSPWARRPRTPRTARRTTRGIRPAFRAAPAAAPRPRSRPGSRRGRSAPTPAAR